MLQLEAMAQVGAVMLMNSPDNQDKIPYFMSLDKVKFRRPIQPGDQMRIEVEVLRLRTRMSACQGRILVDGQLCCEAEIRAVMMERLRRRGGDSRTAAEQETRRPEEGRGDSAARVTAAPLGGPSELPPVGPVRPAPAHLLRFSQGAARSMQGRPGAWRDFPRGVDWCAWTLLPACSWSRALGSRMPTSATAWSIWSSTTPPARSASSSTARSSCRSASCGARSRPASPTARLAGEGGPVDRHKGLLLHACMDLAGAHPVSPTVAVGGDAAALAARWPDGGDLSGPRLFLGHSGWGLGQLERELEEGAWILRPGRPELLLDPYPPAGLWQQLIEGRHGMPDPSRN